MSNKTYDLIKNIALMAAPVLVLVSALCSIWNVPYCSEITASLAAIDTFLGAFVIVAKKIYEGKTEPNQIGGTD